MMRKLLFLSAALLTLGGCAGESPAATAARNVCASVYADPALNPIRDRIPFDDGAATMAPMAQLSDPGKPDNVERTALRQFDAANRRCWDAWDQAGTSPYVQQARASVSSALAELYGGQSTYGDFNRKRANALAEMNARLREADERERAAYYNNRMMFCDPWGPWPYRSLHCF
jgi:hypothetical protein